MPPAGPFGFPATHRPTLAALSTFQSEKNVNNMSAPSVGESLRSITSRHGNRAVSTLSHLKGGIDRSAQAPIDQQVYLCTDGKLLASLGVTTSTFGLLRR